MLVSFASAQQPPTLVLLNGDCDGDNEVTLFDHGLLTASFGLTEADPGFNPNADLDGDGEASLLITTSPTGGSPTSETVNIRH